MAGKPELQLAYENGALDFAQYIIDNPCVLEMLKSRTRVSQDTQDNVVQEIDKLFERWYEQMLPMFKLVGVM